MQYPDKLAKSENGTPFSGSARILAKRNMGKIAFWTARFLEGNVQLILQQKTLENFREALKIPIGSIIEFEGKKTITKKQVHSIEVERLSPGYIRCGAALPEKYHGLSDGNRYRNRVLDLISNVDAFEFFKRVSKAIETVRVTLYENGYREFNTGVLQEVFEGGQASSFSTVCKANGKTLHLSLTSELKLKRLLVSGFEKVFEISQSFRNEGLDAIHSPEFTLLEYYACESDYLAMMDLLELITRAVIKECLGKEEVEHFAGITNPDRIDYASRFERVTFQAAFEKNVGDYGKCSLEYMQKAYPDMFYGSMSTFTWLMKVIEKFLVPQIMQPTFLTGLPGSMSPFAKTADDGVTTERAFFISQGTFIADIYTDENDYQTLRAALEEQAEITGQPANQEYLDVVALGMPKTAGVGMGMNRLYMLMLGDMLKNIKETMLYPIT